MSRSNASPVRGKSLGDGRESLLAVLALVPGALALARPAAFFDAVDVAACGAGTVLGVDVLCYPFLQRALVAAVCVALVAPLVGTFLVYRQMALIGDALAHTAFAGVAIGLFVGSVGGVPVSPAVAALVVAVVAALGIETIVERTDAGGDVTMAIVLTGGFALGTVVVSLTDGGLSVGIKAYLFGSLATVTRHNAAMLLALSGAVLAAVALTYRQLVTVTIDETAARVAGLDVRRYNRLLVVLTAVVVVAAMQILGIILVAAMLVVPVATAAPVARGFTHAVLVSVVAAHLAVVGGILVSYVGGVAVGGTIVLASIALYGAVTFLQRSGIGPFDPSGDAERAR